MRPLQFLLIAPEDREPDLGAGPRRVPATERAEHRSPELRFRDLEQEFDSRFYARTDVPTDRSPYRQAILGRDARISRVRQHSGPAGVVWSLLVDVDIDELPDPSTAELETQLSSLTVTALGALPQSQLLWVSRTLVVDAAASRDLRFDRWLERTDRGGRSAVPAFAVAEGELIVGWGNCLLRGEEPGSLIDMVESSLVVAQLLWAHLVAISESAGSTLLDSIDRGEGTLARPGPFVRKVEMLSQELSIHHMLTDEFMNNSQGAIAAPTILQTWGFRDYEESTRRRIADLRRMAEDAQARQQRSYQRTVEMVLASIGMLAVLDVSVAVIQLAFSGGVGAVPGGGSRLGILNSVRMLGADGALVVGAGAVLVLIVTLARSSVRRRVD